MTWTAPPDLDPELLSLCTAINALDGVETTQSCSGHGERGISVALRVRDPSCLLPLLYSIDPCHGAQPGWRARVYTDCVATEVSWALDGPAGAYEAAAAIAEHLTLTAGGNV